MAKLYHSPPALLPKGTRKYVELAGSKSFLAIDEEKDFINVRNIFDELSLGEYWRDTKISSQIEKLTIKHEDAEALYDSNILVERIISTLDDIMSKGLIFLGIASFEGNAFETSVFDEMDLAWEDQETLMNLYNKSRMQEVFPDVRKGLVDSNEYVECNWFGTASKYFTLPGKKNLNEIAAMLYPYSGNVSGIVAVAQGAANFIILTDSFLKSNSTDTGEIRIDIDNLNQMFHLVEKGVLATPISWFKIDFGLKSLEVLTGWDEIKDLEQIKKVQDRYLEYHKNLIKQKKKTIENILDEDLGRIIDISCMTEEEIESDLSECMATLNTLNEMQLSSQEISLLYKPPKVLFSYGDLKRAAIFGAMSLLSIDIGSNILCVADLRMNLSWGEYVYDEFYKKIDDDSFLNLEGDKDFIELENPLQLRDIYSKSFQDIMHGGEIFLGLLELESNAFEFSLFQELDIGEQDLETLQQFYQDKSEVKLPSLKDGHVQIRWFGDGKEYFTFINHDCIGIYDLADIICSDPAYDNKYATGIVCFDSDSTYFFILNNNFKKNSNVIDEEALEIMYHKLLKSDMAPLCWFKITLGLESLKKHAFWKQASQFSTLGIILQNYKKYLMGLTIIKEKEKKYRIY
ncbi:hypothetical protein DSAG12_01307 [Promethearchaeum syntrophicum]|uniref:Uncharacterized protein n=1 Tax=Promethearchaeum syntrophicum TaxID=2594042 RepID=A0A5B9D8Y8_9ARCH|nr:hypothetical protein [Candidatus Prometheoarchaeum syntrophicum]QEE15481.1 hypothetical protein DSAG12_01307 [Candidatus Prometheoarchaeum syntrophicum]